jgi:WhiB family transcriptional regulator, redox-sensing transcriptional regulator
VLILGSLSSLTDKWKNQGNCRNSALDFYAIDDLSIRAAKEVCRNCPVKAQCLQTAVRDAEEGVWGGTSERDRRAMKRGRKRYAGRMTGRK